MIKINNEDINYITRVASRLSKRYSTNDPFEISQGIGALVRMKDLGTVKGMYIFHKRNRFIVINSSLCDEERKIVCAHELGHDVLHRKFCEKSYLYDTHLYNFSLKPELEANVFSAELLIKDEDVLSNAKIYETISAMSGDMGVPPDLLKLKCAVMKTKGIDLPFESDFDYNIFKSW